MSAAGYIHSSFLIVVQHRSSVMKSLKVCALTAAAAFALVFGLAAPASAHAAVVTGQTSCVDGVHHITWSIHNDYNLPMNITSANTTFGAADVADTSVTNLGTTSATSTAPGSETGTNTLTVHAEWSDEFSGNFSGSVQLGDPCTVVTTTTTTTDTTTTTTTPETTTTIPVSSTTTTEPTTSTTHPDTTTSSEVTTTTYPCDTSSSSPTPPPPSCDTTTSTPPVPPPPDFHHPHTGSNPFPVVGLGSALVAVGLAFARRGTHLRAG